MKPSSKPAAPTQAARPAVHLHIEKLVLHGLPFNGRQARQFQTALETELVQLLGREEYRAQSGAVESLATAQVNWGPGSAADLGGQVAGSIYRSLRT